MPTCPYLDPIKPSNGGWSLAHPYTLFLTILLMTTVILAHRTTITVTLQVAAALIGDPASSNIAFHHSPPPPSSELWAPSVLHYRCCSPSPLCGHTHFLCGLEPCHWLGATLTLLQCSAAAVAMPIAMEIQHLCIARHTTAKPWKLATKKKRRKTRSIYKRNLVQSSFRHFIILLNL